jgi:hypothetical protein
MQEVFDRKPEDKRSFGRLGLRWQLIKVGPNEIGYQGVDWIHQAQDLVQCYEHDNRCLGCRKGGHVLST